MGSVKNYFHDEIVRRADKRNPDAPAEERTTNWLRDNIPVIRPARTALSDSAGGGK